MITKNRMLFREEPDDKGGESKGTAVFDDVVPDGSVEDGASSEAGSEQDKPTDTPPATTVDASELAKQFGDVLAERFKPAVAEEQTVDKLSPEEAKKLLNVWEPTKEWVTKFENLDTREAALGEMRDGLVKHTDTISQFRMRELEKSIRGELGPITKWMEDYQNEQSTARFHKKYDQLSDPALEPLVSAVTEGLKKAGKKFDKESDMFDAIASGVEKVIQVSNKDFKLTAGSSPANKQKGQSANGIPVTTPGAGGGTGGGGKKEVPMKAGQRIFVSEE